MRIVYSKHALTKFINSEIMGMNFTKTQIKEALSNPDFQLEIYERDVEYVLKKINSHLNLRVIYRKVGGIIHVITFYPVKKGRYEK